MKPTILALCILHCAFCILPASGRTPEQIAGDLFVFTNRILRLEHPKDRNRAFHARLQRGAMTPDELSSALVLAAESLAGSTNWIDANSRRFAVNALGEFGTTNALPFLERGMRGDGPADPTDAMWATVNLSRREPIALERLSAVLRDGRQGDAGFRRDVYSRISVSLEYGKPDETRRKTLCGFLLGATSFETSAAGRLDELLCRVEPAFRESPERLRMASRLAEAELANGVTNGTFRALESSLRAKLGNGAVGGSSE